MRAGSLPQKIPFRIRVSVCDRIVWFVIVL